MQRIILLSRRRKSAPTGFSRDVPVELGLRVLVPDTLEIDNDLARLSLKGELNITGTPASPQINGALTTDRGKLVFRNVDFVLTQSTLNFLAARGFDPNFNITAETELGDYRVFLRAWGAPGDNHIELSSYPALPPEDVNNLLMFGVTRSEAEMLDDSASFGSLGLEFLTAVSGVDNTFKRHTRQLKIEQLSVASGYSNITKTTEPRVKVVLKPSEKVRVIYSSSLSNMDDRTAQVEVKLNDLTSLRGEYDNTSDQLTVPNVGLDFVFGWEF